MKPQVGFYRAFFGGWGFSVWGLGFFFFFFFFRACGLRVFRLETSKLRVRALVFFGVRDSWFSG